MTPSTDHDDKAQPRILVQIFQVFSVFKPLAGNPPRGSYADAFSLTRRASLTRIPNVTGLVFFG